MIYDKMRILLNPFVGLLLGCKSSYNRGEDGACNITRPAWYCYYRTDFMITVIVKYLSLKIKYPHSTIANVN